MMLLRLIKWPVVTFTVAALSFAIISLSSAKTTVAPVAGDNCAFTVTVQLAFAFLDEGSQNKADDLIKNWSQAMSNKWNGADGHQTFGDCGCKVTFVFDIKKLDAGQDCRQAPAGYHCYNVVDQPTNQRGNVADSHVVPPDGNKNGFGEWTTGASGNDAAHEIGHLMGLVDEYRYEDTDNDGQKDDYVNTNPQKNADGSLKPKQSIMAQTWGDVAPTQEQIDQIMKDSGHECPGECCCGNGKVDDNNAVTEECDYQADPSGCAGDQACTDECMCIGGLLTPKCGDGQVTHNEACDDNASPQGCPDNEFCVECMCFGSDDIQESGETVAPGGQQPPPGGGGAPPGGQPPGGGAGGGGDEPTGGSPTTDTGEDDESDTGCECGPGTACDPTGGHCVPVACETDADCDDGDPCSHNTCANPGAHDAYCTKTWITGCGDNDGCCAGGCTAATDNDCPAECGDGHCSPGEGCDTCPDDCGHCDPGEPVCGDGTCDAGHDEDCETCPHDCGTCEPVCGDGHCYPSEECVCLEDCPVCALPQCTDEKDNDGDGLIDMADPGCLHPLDEAEYDDWCGNGICETLFGEDLITCPIDC